MGEREKMGGKGRAKERGWKICNSQILVGQDNGA